MEPRFQRKISKKYYEGYEKNVTKLIDCRICPESNTERCTENQTDKKGIGLKASAKTKKKWSKTILAYYIQESIKI